MTLPSYPPSGGVRLHRSPHQWWKVHAKRYAIYYTISICILFLWSGSYLRTSFQHNYEDQQPVARVRSNKNNKRSNPNLLPKRSIHEIASKLPMWNALQHSKNPSVTLTGSFRYRGSNCVDRRDTSCEGKLYFPAVDLKNALAYDEAVDLIRNIQRNTTRQPSVVGNTLSFSKTSAVLTRGGNKDFQATGSVTANQDALFLLQLAPNHAVYEKRHDFIMGLFDGHGTDGHVISQYAALHLPEMLVTHLANKKQSPQEALSSTFLEIDESLPEAAGSGSTAICLLRLQNMLYIANTGDSFAFVASHDAKTSTTEILYRTKPHKPLNPEEKKRIEAAGGEVVEPQGPGDSSRVIIPMHDGSVEMVMALAMSRSIGDKDGTPLGVIPDPTVDTLDLNTVAASDKGLFAVVASDGLLDRIDEKEVADSIALSLFSSNTKQTPLEACEELILKSSRGWIASGSPYRDDISVATTILARDSST